MRRLVAVVIFPAILLASGGGVYFQLIRPLAKALGFGEEMTYLVLLQNHKELRPTGGFMGSYALITLKTGLVTSFQVQDIYEPDGQITAHVSSPEPIQEAFQLGSWRLRDTNWEPDFREAAQTISWFFNKAGEREFDAVAASNLLVFEELLSLLGPVELVDYGVKVTSENLWEQAQAHAQVGFFPGSKQKREFLSDLAVSVRQKFSLSSGRVKLSTVRLLFRMLTEKQVMIFFKDSGLQRFVERLGWAGRVDQAVCPMTSKGCLKDYLMVVEANLGVNKANCCVERDFSLVLNRDEMVIHHQLRLMFKNRAGSAWSGDYRAWVRVLAPDAEEEQGFWVEVPVGEEREYLVEYDLSFGQASSSLVSLLIQKQSGIEALPLRLEYFEGGGLKRIEDLNLRSDLQLILR